MKEQYSSDKPVKIEKEDRFQRYGFSKRIAETIIQRENVNIRAKIKEVQNHPTLSNSDKQIDLDLKKEAAKAKKSNKLVTGKVSKKTTTKVKKTVKK